MSQVYSSLANELECLDNIRNLEEWSQKKAFTEWRHNVTSKKREERKDEVVRVKERVNSNPDRPFFIHFLSKFHSIFFPPPNS